VRKLSETGIVAVRGKKKGARSKTVPIEKIPQATLSAAATQSSSPHLFEAQ